jgi:hypothetical protein
VPAAPTAVLPSIPFECPCCLRHLRVAAQFAGNLIRCPVCRGMATVPGEAAPTPAVSPDEPTTPFHVLAKPVRG